MNGEIQNNPSGQERQHGWNDERGELSWGTAREWLMVAGLALIAGCVAMIPQYAGWDEDFYYPRNAGFVFLPVMVIYFSWKRSIPIGKVLGLLAVLVVSAVYINLLPGDDTNDTLLLACIHLPLMIWALLGFAYAGADFRNREQRIDFLRFNGDLVVLGTVILIAGGILSAVTIGLFGLIQLNIGEFYFRKVALWGVAAVPVVATHLVTTNPRLIRNVSPVVARIFTPLVLVMLVVYLTAMVVTGKDPYNDREFLLVFNILLVGVMIIILFSVAETSGHRATRLGVILLFLLSLVTVVVNGIALSAIVFRITEWGITPNRLAVLGSNVLILINLIGVAYRLFRSIRNPAGVRAVESNIAGWLPVYAAWMAVVTFGFPLLFGFR